MSAWREDGKQVVIRLSPKAAALVFSNVDGWMDAGACEGGLRPDESRALGAVRDQIRKQLAQGSDK